MIADTINRIFLNRYIKKNKRQRYKELVSLQRAKTAAMICQIEDEDSYKKCYALLSKLHNRGRKGWLLGYINDKIVPYYCLEQLSADYFCNKHLNWFGKPEHAQLNDFLKQDFDILIDFTKNELSPIKYCLQMCKAKFIVGNSNYNKEFYDLLIEGEKISEEELLENIEKYTEQLSGNER